MQQHGSSLNVFRSTLHSAANVSPLAPMGPHWDHGLHGPHGVTLGATGPMGPHDMASLGPCGPHGMDGWIDAWERGDMAGGLVQPHAKVAVFTPNPRISSLRFAADLTSDQD